MRAQALELLLGSREKAAAAAGTLDSTGGWPKLVATCSDWRVLAQLNRRLIELGCKLPGETRAEFRQLTQTAFLRTSQCLLRGAVALRALDQGGVPAAGFKGVAAAAMLHSRPAERTLQDVDILIREKDLDRALALLADSGFVPAISGTLSDYIDFVRNSPGFAGNEAVALSDGRGGSVDLHWRLGCLPVESLLDGAVTVRLFGQALRVVLPAHSMTIAAHHALRNDFVPDEIVRDLLDFRGWVPCVAALESTAEAMSFAQSNALTGSLLALAELLGGFGNPAPAGLIAGADAEDRRIAADLAELCQSQIRDGLLNTDLVYLASPGSLRQIIAGGGSGWSRYRAHMRALEQTNGRAAVGLGSRLRKFAGAAWRLPLRHWRLVRRLTTLKDGNIRR